MKIKTITAELLREGPRHNHLLSPLTRYLGISGDAKAGVVTVPYEHAELSRKLNELRYKVTDEEEPGRRRDVLHEMGSRIAEILGQIPGLDGSLKSELSGRDTLTHLRLVLSASELALLPFEASKVPAGAASPENWLSLRSDAPVCVTRKVRAVSSEAVEWPQEPKILYVTGPNVPFEEHKRALLEAIKPWVKPRQGEDYWLTILEDTTLEQIRSAFRATPYTHVHVLAHGAVDEGRTGDPFGVLIGDTVLSGRDLGSALVHVSSEGVRVPTVVTLATCDSAQQKQVYTPDASVAHELHEEGIALVVASQFPLSVEGSIPFVHTFYGDQMWGEHPLLSLYRARLDLHGRPDVHDWASLVVYEALPDNLEEQLHHLRYWQARRANNAALDQLEAIIDGGGIPASSDYQRFEDTCRKMPVTGPYKTESVGLKASAHKRMAEIRFTLSQRTQGGAYEENLHKCHACLREALGFYEKAVGGFLVNVNEAMLRKATLHWVGIQVLSMRAVLGERLSEGLRQAAKLAARADVDHLSHPGDKAWAIGSLCEVALLGLADDKARPARREKLATEALGHARKIVELCGRDSEQAQYTARQFRRYFNWWGKPKFAEDLSAFGVPSKTHWRRDNGVIATAKAIAETLVGPDVLGATWRPMEVKIGPEIPVAAAAGATAEAEAEAGPGETGAAETAAATAATATKPRPRRAPTLAAPKASDDSEFVIEMLPARNGDCLWLEYGPTNDRSRVIVDCGAATAARALETRLGQLRNEVSGDPTLDLFILTHIDSDHISGVTRFFRNAKVEFDDVWFNGWFQLPKEHLDPKFLGVKQAEEYSKLLAEQKRPWNRRAPKDRKKAKHPGPIWIPKSGELPAYTLPGGMTLTLLSPGQEQLGDLAKKWAIGRRELEPSQRFLGGKRPPPVDDPSKLDLEKLAAERTDPDSSVANGSSIAVLAEYGDKTALLMGDAHAEVVAASVRQLLTDRKSDAKRLKIDALKLSHHGSANGLSEELLGVLDCRRYLVSTNGSHFYHPHREAIARVVLHGGESPALYFNYAPEDNQYSQPWADEDLQEKYGYHALFPPAGKPGMRVPL